MRFEAMRTVMSRRPFATVAFWALLVLAVGLLAPDLSRLAAEGQANLLGEGAESRRAAAVVAAAWPDESYESMAVVALHRPTGLSAGDRDYAKRLSGWLRNPERPKGVLRVLGPDGDPDVASRLVSKDGTVSLVAIPLSTSLVSPAGAEAVAWLQRKAGSVGPAPAGLEVLWTGDAVVGRDYMAGVKASLDRAAASTVVLLLLVLLAVYRSVWLALVPLATIGVSLVISRGVLAWLFLAGWEISSLVELFLIAVLFGSGTDFCLFVSWRFAEHWDAADPPRAMNATLRRAALALMTSAGTVVVGLSLMGTTKFKLFSTTGPSVALGLVISLAATLTLTPALLVLLARYRPQAYRGLTRPSSGFWERVGRLAMDHPSRCWAAALAFMLPLALLSARTRTVQDLISEVPETTPSARAFRLLMAKFDAGMLTPLTVVLESQADLRGSEGLALIDDVSRFLDRQKGLSEVRSATQPLGSPELLARARIAARMGAVDDGFRQIREGAASLRTGLDEGAAKIRAAIWIEEHTGLNLSGNHSGATAPAPATSAAVSAGFRKASAALLGNAGPGPWANLGSAGKDDPAHPPTSPPTPDGPAAAQPPRPPPKGDARRKLADELTRAAEGAGKIADGAARADQEMRSILRDPVGRRALDVLLVNAATLKANPELRRSFDNYLTADGHRARIDVAQGDRLFSGPALDEVVRLRAGLKGFLAHADGPAVSLRVAGANAESADVRALTRSDQLQSWFVIPTGVFLVLLLALRDPLACVNLVLTMLLTYAFALGVTHLAFVTVMGDEGIDWKVPYFLFVLLVAVGVDYNVFLMARLRDEAKLWGLREGIVKAVGQTGGLISSAAAITACSFASFMTSPLVSLRQLGFALVVGIAVDALLVRPLLVPCGHWLLSQFRNPQIVQEVGTAVAGQPNLSNFVRLAD